jgi:DNA-binding MarR family transcriptional regulator
MKMGAAMSDEVTGAGDARIRELFAARGVAFLLSQVGALSSKRWAERIAEFGLDPRQTMLFWNVAIREGQSQSDLGQAMQLPSSRIVGLVDLLEKRGWIRRSTNPRDRRARALFLTPAGHRAVNRMLKIAAEHEADLSGGLDPEQREALIRLLEIVAAKHGLRQAVHPDF